MPIFSTRTLALLKIDTALANTLAFVLEQEKTAADAQFASGGEGGLHSELVTSLVKAMKAAGEKVKGGWSWNLKSERLSKRLSNTCIYIY